MNNKLPSRADMWAAHIYGLVMAGVALWGFTCLNPATMILAPLVVPVYSVGIVLGVAMVIASFGPTITGVSDAQTTQE